MDGRTVIRGGGGGLIGGRPKSHCDGDGDVGIGDSLSVRPSVRPADTVTAAQTRLRDLSVRSGVFCVCKLMVSTNATLSGTIHTQSITELVTGPSKLSPKLKPTADTAVQRAAQQNRGWRAREGQQDLLFFHRHTRLQDGQVVQGVPF